MCRVNHTFHHHSTPMSIFHTGPEGPRSEGQHKGIQQVYALSTPRLTHLMFDSFSCWLLSRCLSF